VRTAVSVDTGDWEFKQQGWFLDTRLRYQRSLLTVHGVAIAFQKKILVSRFSNQLIHTVRSTPLDRGA
jgi:hypothetical protein